jgi:ubiquinone/menaquinone biosynthesis C-methylase UbiE
MKYWIKFIKFFQQPFRDKRGKILKKIYPDYKSLKILDLGGSESFWIELNIEINPENITILNISNYQKEYSKLPGIKKLTYDGNKIPFEDKSYDLVICNSVIEHVKKDQRIIFSKEIMRVGKKFFLQTPCFYFPIEPHFVLPLIHWLPKKVGYYFIYISPWKILVKPDKETINEYFFNTNLLKEDELVDLFKNAKIYKEKFLGLTKSYIFYT